MSTSISSVPESSPLPDAAEPNAEAQKIVPPHDGADAPESKPPSSHPQPAEPDREGDVPTEKSGRGLIVLALAALLLGSVAINLKQSRDLSVLETRSQEYQQALAAAVERIDTETARAEGAEAALSRVDDAVALVNQQMVGLGQALEQLRRSTQR
jgi:hypothetical protein